MMQRVYQGPYVDIFESEDRMKYIVDHRDGKKTFTGEMAWQDAQRFAWDKGDFGCYLG